MTNRKNAGNDKWKALGKKDRPFGPPVRFRLRPEDVFVQRGDAMDEGRLTPPRKRSA